MKHFTFLKNFKVWAIAAIAVIVAGIFVASFLGFNLSYDYTGGTEVNVLVVSTENEVLDKVSKDVNDVLSAKGLTAAEITKSESLGETDFIFKIQSSLTDDELITLQSAVVDKLNADIENTVTVNTYHSVVTTNGYKVLWMCLAAGITLIIAFIYLAIRYKWAIAFAAICVSVVDMLIVIALFAITRIPVTASFYAILYASMAITLLLATLFASAVKGELRNVANDGADKLDLAFQATWANIIATISVCCLVVLMGLAFVIVGAPALKAVGLQMIVGIIAPVYVTVTLLGFIWATFSAIGSKKAA